MLQYFRVKKRSRQKLMTLLINQVLFSFEMRKYASFVEITMIRMAITKAQVVSFDSWNMRYTSSNFVTLIYWKTLLLLKPF